MMIRVFQNQNGRLVTVEPSPATIQSAVWIDLEAPTPEEEQLIERSLMLDIPTREDMQEIEPSSRIYHEEGTLYLTAQILASKDMKSLDIGPVTFMLTQERLVTVHYHHPGSFDFFAELASRQNLACSTGLQTFLALTEAIVDRIADILENESRRLEVLSRRIFDARRPDEQGERLAVVLQRIGGAEDRNSKVTESLTTLQRILGYLSVPGTPAAKKLQREIERDRMKSLIHDARSLREESRTQSEKIRFQLDATLGVISIRQSDIIKVFSVVAFVFLPPTLIASIYGMNFVVMPELKWTWGYPFALALMLVSAVVPWLLFRWKRLL